MVSSKLVIAVRTAGKAGGFPLDSLAKSGFPLLIRITVFLHTNSV